MATLSDVQELNDALHRKLLNINSDIRKLRNSKYPDEKQIKLLKENSKAVDKVLSKGVQLYIHFESLENSQELYNEYHNFYKSS